MSQESLSGAGVLEDSRTADELQSLSEPPRSSKIRARECLSNRTEMESQKGKTKSFFSHILFMWAAPRRYGSSFGWVFLPQRI